ncbi:MAG: indolepyruvate ferredoxin oxidoreductase subunit alpha [Acidobacteriota bacterium]|nr:indolepyruvate ferredoxin oxidoreductase subunit alpha [Acidobacteriota bacterium]
MSEKMILSGNEAVARGAWEAGATFGSGYPGTPSSEILPALNALGDCYTEWAPNEKCALEAAAGASLAGARCIVTMKHVGLNVAADPFFTLSYVGVNGGLVLLDADDPAMHSSQNEQDNRHFARAAKVPMLEPSDSQEAKDFTRLAFEISEQFDTPVMVRTLTRVAHSEGLVELGERTVPARECGPVRDARKYVMIPAYARARRAFMQERTAKLTAFAEETEINCIEPGSPEIGIIASSVAYQYAREAAPDASFLKLGMTWPLPPGKIRQFAASVEKLYVVEELDPYLRDQILALGIAVEELPESLQLGELSPERVAAGLRGEDVAPAASDLPPRPPVLCAGCPHRGVFITLRKLKAFVTGDIGCYTLGTLPPLSALDTCLCMGAGIGEAHGIEMACGEKGKTVAVIGDSTFVHSGITGLVNIAYNGGSSVVMILDNATTAMTGGQEHPGTGVTLSGRPGRLLDIPGICRAAGIPNVVTVDPRNLEQVESTLKQALESPEAWVIVAQCPCILKARPDAFPRVIDEDKCIRCQVCVRIGCPAISTEATDDPRKTQPRIDPVLCTGCNLCAQVCPVNAISEMEGGACEV